MTAWLFFLRLLSAPMLAGTWHWLRWPETSAEPTSGQYGRVGGRVLVRAPTQGVGVGAVCVPSQTDWEVVAAFPYFRGAQSLFHVFFNKYSDN
ncbi:hypothetical protein H257_00757 [Aphanomyces astaci]|uniref:Secreted protein n=1 Tax=Aphanomyces astaci TaxID=112090 RepID=W4HEB3_APHAT|nr:hypothetical protein H257_00757 [Aphanomyces astaci]ETV89493.1 hypothetical protein H257_00757 [Aphanomyces astaci]|eukprot:XP_009821893.1 hypothetical protein H257_00757 [Aphanomyces astaci]